jgi:hypothetical protein
MHLWGSLIVQFDERISSLDFFVCFNLQYLRADGVVDVREEVSHIIVFIGHSDLDESLLAINAFELSNSVQNQA